jgi:2,4-dienoyl-CoA reductase (NADPH2)
VIQAWDVLSGRVETGRKVVVIGGGAVGCEVALYLAQIGTLTPDELHFLFVNQAETTDTLMKLATHGLKEITMVEMTGRIGSDIGQSTGWIMRQDLGRYGVGLMTNTSAMEITPAGVVVEKNQERATVAADTVVLALGTRTENSLYQSIQDLSCRVILVGDALQPAKAYDAVHQAFAAALEI